MRATLKACCTVLLAIAMAWMPSTTMGVVPPPEVACAAPAESCCEQPSGHHATPAKACDQPVDNCAHCSLVCCAFLPAKPEPVPMPGQVEFRWKMTAEKGEARNEPPPLPPPRVS